MQILNTKALIIIAALVASIVSFLVRQESRSLRQEQRQLDIAQHDKERWESLREYQKTQPHNLGGMEQALKNHRAY